MKKRKIVINNDYLHRQLIRLGDMMGDGAHHEPDGKWIEKEYKKILKVLGMLPKVKRNVKGINKAMIVRIKKVKCTECDGDLKQTKSGSMRARCIECGNKFQLLKRNKKK